MQAIVTRYHPAGQKRAPRMSAVAHGGRVSVPVDGDLGAFENHAAAVVALCQKMKWGGEWVSGGLPDGVSVCWVDLAGDHVVAPPVTR